MDISKLNTQVKSVLLAKVRGWKITNSDRIKGLQFVHDDSGTQIHISRDEPFIAYNPFDLYDPAQMALAFRYHLWAINHRKLSFKYQGWCLSNLMVDDKIGPFWVFAIAQTLWLDQILTFVIEEGIMDLEVEIEMYGMNK